MIFGNYTDFKETLREGLRTAYFHSESIPEISMTSYLNFIEIYSLNDEDDPDITSVFQTFSIVITVTNNTINCFLISKNKINGANLNESKYLNLKRYFKKILATTKYASFKMKILT